MECGRGASRSACTGTHSGEGCIVMRPYAYAGKLTNRGLSRCRRAREGELPRRGKRDWPGLRPGAPLPRASRRGRSQTGPYTPAMVRRAGLGPAPTTSPQQIQIYWHVRRGRRSLSPLPRFARHLPLTRGVVLDGPFPGNAGRPEAAPYPRSNAPTNSNLSQQIPILLPYHILYSKENPHGTV